MNATTYSTSAAVCCYSGHAATGKTTSLVNSACKLLRAGVSPNEILFLAATPSAAQRTADLFCQALEPDAAPRVTTPLQAQLEVLATPEAVARTGREPRIAHRFEENILMEDMKTCGMQSRRLSEMLRFFYRSWTELEPMDHSWFYSDEEENTHALLEAYLRYYRVYLKNEVAAAAYRFLDGNADALQNHRVGYVFVDDYQSLSKASQCFAGLLASQGLWVAGDGQVNVGAEDFPYPKGLSELVAGNPHAQVHKMNESNASRSVVDGLNGLLTDEAIAAQPLDSCDGASNGTCDAIAAPLPDDEFNRVAEIVRTALDAGVEPELVHVASPNRKWMKVIARTLAEQGVPVAVFPTLKIAGDMRDTDLCLEARIVTILRLMANPDDPLALRCWYAFGDYLGNSAIARMLCEQDYPLSLSSARLDLAGEGNALLEQQGGAVLDSLESARTVIGRILGATGLDLVARIAAELSNDRSATLPRTLELAIGHKAANAAPSALLDAIQDAVFFAQFASAGVRVGMLEDFVGLRAHCAVAGGMVNGFVPSRAYFDPTIVERDKRPKILAGDMRRIYSFARSADSELRFTYFEQAPLKDAEQLKLKIERIRLIRSQRLCEIHPSETIRSLTGVSFHE
ncbi:Uncharacterised protein [Slackia heliotrinireducens]|uniref:DNA/RNA helicase, superfamily I n=1 Tax=Slackia heliotrinireducens (strain ATCC 29202 / DSM 20476 / NCTC 11029 / RHS 1) TaxID=471855 RepID=C7N727_SLAHD|nr:hypothetical protein [Slackia heliotrinireducens]ACV22712.1 DNA/RNA helicase, superfamily I [Slackia heliotrinireducens DSM 20476]VEH01330.1 Uncharacterised protein [Slackia heliotrinireducens]